MGDKGRKWVIEAKNDQWARLREGGMKMDDGTWKQAVEPENDRVTKVWFNSVLLTSSTFL
jgi:hypothetical protein